ncbi:hypothetical protein PHMEG_00023702 [Phytophthora megakarya]|uniref:Eukaryotic/viral aspartic protease n=1 Tax=Phytophthora megakarya TaxID=4795 RepID=A0A225VH11_9STRA|nr:hypothetical protein PHMEG_00023702 [Phytophthora megakarya]
MSTTTRVKVKVTIIWNTVYEFEFWVMDHSAGSEEVFGTDFMISAGIGLDLYNATAKFPGKEMVMPVKAISADEYSAEGMHVTGGPTKRLQIPAGEWIEFRLQNVNIFRNSRCLGVAHYCADPDDQSVQKRTANFAWVPPGFMPKQAGYLPIDFRKYEQW